MKDQLFEILLSLFEQTLNHLRDHQEQLQETESKDVLIEQQHSQFEYVQSPSDSSIRILTLLEQVKLTKPAIQFLMRLMHTGMLNAFQFEEVMNLVLESQHRYVTVEEVGIIIHQVLSESLSQRELLMLEFAFDLETSPTTMH
jgi:hypothetical protein